MRRIILPLMFLLYVAPAAAQQASPQQPPTDLDILGQYVIANIRLAWQVNNQQGLITQLQARIAELEKQLAAAKAEQQPK